MAWTILTEREWRSRAEDALRRTAEPLRSLAADYDVVAPSMDATFALHDGPLTVDGDAVLPARNVLVLGSLEVSGRVTTEGADGADGNAALVVIGDLACRTLVNDWASIVVVSGELTVVEWAFAAREDSAILVGGTFRTPLFIGADIWIEVGAGAEIEAGIGYALDMARAPSDRPVPIEPKSDATALLGLPPDLHEAMNLLEDRLYSTGTIVPAR